MNLETLKSRTDEVGECWIWTGTTSSAGYPIVKVTGCGCKLARRLAFEYAGGVLAVRQPIDTTCNDKLCINPDHLFASTTKKIALKASKQGKFSTLQRGLAIARGIQHRKKLSDEAVSEIRCSTESGPVLAARHSVDKSLISRIKAGHARKDYANPYLQLMSGGAR